jgi:uncharacterized membrane protein
MPATDRLLSGTHYLLSRRPASHGLHRTIPASSSACVKLSPPLDSRSTGPHLGDDQPGLGREDTSAAEEDVGMAEIHKSVSINAPAERVFDLIDDPGAIPSYTPNVERVEDVQQSEHRIGDTFRVIYKAVGATFKETFTVTEYERPTRLASRFENGMKGTFVYQVTPQGEQTTLTVDVQYQLPAGALGKAVDSLLLERTNETTIEKQLDNLRQLAAQASTSPTSDA